MKAIFILLITLFIGSTITPKNKTNNALEDCDAQLSVWNNETTKLAGENGTRFILILKNTSSNTATYTLSAKNLENPCDLESAKSSGKYLPLSASFKLDDSKNKITLSSGQSNKFAVKINIPIDASNSDWGCIEIEAKPEDCNTNNVKTVLSVYVPSL
tara:strand:- start:2011 stop:2484 length:474 start_codon:yes stop_codon:yes gene_type:complete